MHGLTLNLGGIAYVFWDYSSTRIPNQIQLTFSCVAGKYWPFWQYEATQVTLGGPIPRLFDLNVYRNYNDRFIYSNPRQKSLYGISSCDHDSALVITHISFSPLSVCPSRSLYIWGIPACGRCTHSYTILSPFLSAYRIRILCLFVMSWYLLMYYSQGTLPG